MEDSRLSSIGALYGGGSKSIKTEKKTKASKPKEYSPKKNSFSTISHYNPNENKEDKGDAKENLSGIEKWRKENRILRKELDETKKELSEEKRKTTDLERQIKVLQQ
tara:strand:- start:62 stop:382 length:321 start_codon:yes stop_codon:yes gene_type:complete